MSEITTSLTAFDDETAEEIPLTVTGDIDDRFVTIYCEGLSIEIDGYKLFKALSYTELVDDQKA